jgi:Flp pilus assembly protein TadD
MDPATPIPQSAPVFAALGNIARLMNGDPRIAAAKARELLKRYPGQRQALFLLVASRRLAGDAGGAKTLLQAMARAEPDLAAVQYELGLLLAESGDGAGALAALARVVELEPMHPDAWRDLGDLLAAAGRTEEAAAAYRAHLCGERGGDGSAALRSGLG